MRTLLCLCAVAALFCLSVQKPPDSTHAGMAGREFVFSFLHNEKKSWPRYTQLKLFITTVKDVATVYVKAPRFQQKVTVPPLRSVMVTLPWNIELFDSKRSGKTVRVDATADVSITSFSLKRNTAETSVVHPTTLWGTEYVIFTPSPSHADKHKEFSVTNGKKANNVHIYLQSHAKFEGKYFQKGRKLQVNLQPYEVIQIQSPFDLTNTRIVSQKPVAVITGHSCTKRFSKCNHVYEQLLPVSAWGTNIIVPAIYHRKDFNSVYIQASQCTIVKIMSHKYTRTIRMTKLSVYEHKHRAPTPLIIQANHGIQVLLLFNGKTSSSTQFSNPFLINMLPTEYFCSSYMLLPLPRFKNYGLIVANQDAAKKMKFPCSRGSWLKVHKSDFLWMTFRMNLKKNQILSSSGSPFGFYSFGLAYANGYGYSYGSAGHCIKPE